MSESRRILDPPPNFKAEGVSGAFNSEDRHYGADRDDKKGFWSSPWNARGCVLFQLREQGLGVGVILHLDEVI